MLKGCDLIDGFLKDLERPIINPNVRDKSFPKIAKLPLLAKPSRRNVEVLVYSADKKWWRQNRVMAGTTETKVYLGDDQTRKGAKFPVVAMTTEQPLGRRNYLNLPDHRTRSDEIILVRG